MQCNIGVDGDWTTAAARRKGDWPMQRRAARLINLSQLLLGPAHTSGVSSSPSPSLVQAVVRSLRFAVGSSQAQFANRFQEQQQQHRHTNGRSLSGLGMRQRRSLAVHPPPCADRWAAQEQQKRKKNRNPPSSIHTVYIYIYALDGREIEIRV